MNLSFTSQHQQPFIHRSDSTVALSVRPQYYPEIKFSTNIYSLTGQNIRHVKRPDMKNLSTTRRTINLALVFHISQVHLTKNLE